MQLKDENEILFSKEEFFSFFQVFNIVVKLEDFLICKKNLSLINSTVVLSFPLALALR